MTNPSPERPRGESIEPSALERALPSLIQQAQWTGPPAEVSPPTLDPETALGWQDLLEQPAPTLRSNRRLYLGGLGATGVIAAGFLVVLFSSYSGFREQVLQEPAPEFNTITVRPQPEPPQPSRRSRPPEPQPEPQISAPRPIPQPKAKASPTAPVQKATTTGDQDKRARTNSETGFSVSSPSREEAASAPAAPAANSAMDSFSKTEALSADLAWTTHYGEKLGQALQTALQRPSESIGNTVLELILTTSPKTITLEVPPRILSSGGAPLDQASLNAINQLQNQGLPANFGPQPLRLRYRITVDGQTGAITCELMAPPEILN